MCALLFPRCRTHAAYIYRHSVLYYTADADRFDAYIYAGVSSARDELSSPKVG